MVFHSCFSTGFICKLQHLMSHRNGLDVSIRKSEGSFGPKCPANGSSFTFKESKIKLTSGPWNILTPFIKMPRKIAAQFWVPDWMNDGLQLGGFWTLRLRVLQRPRQPLCVCVSQSASVGSLKHGTKWIIRTSKFQHMQHQQAQQQHATTATATCRSIIAHTQLAK